MLNSSLFERTILAGSLLAVLCSHALAQGQIPPERRRGLVSGAAVAISSRTGTTPGQDDTIRISPPLDQTTAPAPFDPDLFPGAPDYSLEKLFPSHPAIDIDALSTGNDFIGPIHTDGRANLQDPNPRWQGVTVSVTESAVGNSPDSLLQREPLATIGPAGSLISHYLTGSASGPDGLPVGLVGTTHLEQSKTNLGLDNLADPVIDGLDWAMGIRTWAAGAPGTTWPTGIIFNRGDNELYFSVTKEWADANPSGFASDLSGNGVRTSGADVYRILWDSSTSSWEPPIQILEADDLGLDSSDDLDALAYDPIHHTALHSTTVVSDLRSQILAYQGPMSSHGSVAGVPYLDSAGNPITETLGLEDVSDDVSAICVIDPEPGTVPDPYVGVRLESLGFFPEDIGLSVERTIDGDDLATIWCQATGRRGNPQAEHVVEFLVTHPASGASFTSELPLEETPASPFGVAEWTWPVGNYSGVGELVFCASLWELGPSGRTLVGLSWTTTLEF